jgi:hypothetical protein
MRTKLKSTTRVEKVPISIWKVSGKPVAIDEFIEEGSGCVDATGFRHALRSLNGRLWEKLESINAEEYPHLREAVRVIIQALESPEGWQAKDPLPRWLAEVAFGARYLLKRFDLNRGSPAGDWSRGRCAVACTHSGAELLGAKLVWVSLR